ncbi:hypothetical protein O3Q52_17235 [Streptomyces sp. ActVer]|uniref:hypothetical protein n=1 Tax=Streptomyces sp. ActVer TaxID=3014558 RepID=UPI0022B34785|nr:hypothetical protein [Streptomyces sp. ActVer]MCZ4509908.1 hypothetical protein [Streptomyces sp. ActVer]
MSAPLVVNTTDGTVWKRREGTRDGLALYAPEKCGGCPEFVMATYAELVEHGVAGSADVLPMPVGPGPLPQGDDRVKAPWGRGEDGRPMLPMGAHWTDIPELVDQTLAGIQARVDKAQSGHWYDASATETWRAPGTVCTRVEGYQRTVGQCTNMQPADLELVLHAHDDLSWCLDMVAKLLARVAELEKRLHDAAMTRVWTNEDGKRFVFVEDIAPALLNLPSAPTQALREAEPAESSPRFVVRELGPRCFAVDDTKTALSYDMRFTRTAAQRAADRRNERQVKG